MSDTNSNESDSTTSKDQRYKQNDFSFFAFVASIESMHETNSENESTDEQNVSFLENIFIEYQCLIEKYQKSHDVLDSQKSEINLLCEE